MWHLYFDMTVWGTLQDDSGPQAGEGTSWFPAENEHEVDTA